MMIEVKCFVATALGSIPLGRCLSAVVAQVGSFRKVAVVDADNPKDEGRCMVVDRQQREDTAALML